MDTDMTDELRVAVLGVGKMGSFHVESLSRRTRGARVTVVSDFADEAAHRVGDPIGARVAADPAAAIAADDVDAVVIASPGAAHEAQVLACLEAGQARAVREAADHRGLECRRGVPPRDRAGPAPDPGRLHAPLRPRVRGAAALIAGGELGAPLMLHCTHRNPAVPGLLRLRVHDPRLGRPRGRLRALPARRGDHRGQRGQGPADRGGPGRGVRPDAGALRGRVRGPGHRRDLRPDRARLRGAHRGRRRARVGHHRPRPARADQAARVGARRGRDLGRDDHARLRRAVRAGLRRPDAALGRRGPPRDRDRRDAVDGPGSWDGYAAAAICEAGVAAVVKNERIETGVEARGASGATGDAS